MTIGSDVDLSIGCGYAGTKDRQSDGGAALMTGTKVDIPIMSAVSNMQGNTPLEEAMQQAMDVLGGVPFDDADRAYAARIQATLSDDDIAAEYRQNGLAPRKDSPLCDYIVPPQSRGQASSEHSSPPQPASHVHVPLMQTPWPLQSSAHSAYSQCTPWKPGAQ